MSYFNSKGNVRFALLSAERADQSASTNKLAHIHLQTELETAQLDYKLLKGRYKGVDEVSYLVPVPKDDTYLLVKRLAKQFNQEAILLVDERKIAYLDVLDGAMDRLGDFMPVDQATAEKSEGFTLDVDTGIYYIIK